MAGTSCYGGSAGSASGNLSRGWVTVEDEDELAACTVDQLHNRPTVREDPAHGPVRHLLCEPRLELLNSASELRRDEGACALRVIDFPAAGGEHHDIEAEAELVLELELRIPPLRTLLVGDHIGQLGGSVESGLILRR